MKLFNIILILFFIFSFLHSQQTILPNEDYDLAKPRVVRVNTNNIFVVDENLNTVFKIKKNNINDVLMIGKKGNGPGELMQPDYIFVNDTLLYVNNKGNGKITVFDAQNGDYIRDYKIQTFFFVVDDKNIYTMPSNKTNFKYLIDVFDKNGNYKKSLIKSDIKIKSGSDFYNILGTMAISGDTLCYSFMFNKYEIILYNLKTDKETLIRYPKNLKIPRPDLRKTSQKSGVFIVNSDIALKNGKLYVLSILDKYYAAKRIDVFSVADKKLIGDYKIRNNIKDEDRFEKDIPAYIYFDLDKSYFYFTDMVYKNELVRMAKSKFKLKKFK